MLVGVWPFHLQFGRQRKLDHSLPCPFLTTAACSYHEPLSSGDLTPWNHLLGLSVSATYFKGKEKTTMSIAIQPTVYMIRQPNMICLTVGFQASKQLRRSPNGTYSIISDRGRSLMIHPTIVTTWGFTSTDTLAISAISPRKASTSADVAVAMCRHKLKYFRTNTINTVQIT